MPVTIRDVAKRLNLSITTVSRALDGYSDVAEATRERVIRTAQEMGYVPNRAARQLRKQRSETIGYILPASMPRFSDPFFSEFIAGMGDEASLQNYDLLIFTAPPGNDAEQSIYQRWVQGRKVDGFILNRLRLNDWRVLYLYQQRIPFVTLERTQDGIDHAGIEVDGRTGFKNLVEHLAERGHRRIAYVGGPADLILQAVRLAGYREGLASTGLPYDESLVLAGDLTRQGGYKAAQQLLNRSIPPSAITCANDLMAIGALQAAQERGLQVGRDLAVAGFDGIDETQHTTPPLTTLRQPVYEIACRLVRMLLAQINGDALVVQKVRLQPELIVRASTGG